MQYLGVCSLWYTKAHPITSHINYSYHLCYHLDSDWSWYADQVASRLGWHLQVLAFLECLSYSFSGIYRSFLVFVKFQCLLFYLPHPYPLLPTQYIYLSSSPSWFPLSLWRGVGHPPRQWLWQLSFLQSGCTCMGWRAIAYTHAVASFCQILHSIPSQTV